MYRNQISCPAKKVLAQIAVVPYFLETDWAKTDGRLCSSLATEESLLNRPKTLSPLDFALVDLFLMSFRHHVVPKSNRLDCFQIEKPTARSLDDCFQLLIRKQPTTLSTIGIR
jgi:hypothetical protein